MDLASIYNMASTFERKMVAKLVSRLLRADRVFFPCTGERLNAPVEQGVYVIYSPRGKILHVGRTTRGAKGLRQRLNNHLHTQSSFTVFYMKGHGARLRNGYSFKYLPVENARRRALVEAYAVGLLCPAHIGLSETLLA